MSNAYPEKPVLPYEHTTVAMTDVITYLRSLPTLTEIKRTAYCMFRIESGNGTAGVNNNYAGFQADGARWPSQFDERIIGTVTVAENQTGMERIFLAFDGWQSSVDMLVEEIKGRGMYIDGVSVVTEDDLVGDYYREWVTGDPHAIPSAATVNEFRSIYGQAMALFRDSGEATA